MIDTEYHNSALADLSQNVSLEAGWINGNNGVTRSEAYGKLVKAGKVRLK